MFELFGEFNSAEEINLAAAGLKDEGNIENLKKLAKENGLDEEFAQAYIDGEIPELTNDMLAAVGKLEMERQQLKLNLFTGIIDDLINYLLTSCQEVIFAKAVRSKGKSLQKCMDNCEKNVTVMAEKARKNGERQVFLSVRNSDVYKLEKDYYLS